MLDNTNAHREMSTYFKEQINRNEVSIMKQQHIPICEKFTLTIREASEYFNIGIKNMRKLAEAHTDTFAVHHGNRILIIRSRCEDYILSRLAGVSAALESADMGQHSSTQEKGENQI